MDRFRRRESDYVSTVDGKPVRVKKDRRSDYSAPVLDVSLLDLIRRDQERLENAKSKIQK